MEKEQSNQISIPKSVLRKVKVYAAQNDMKIKEVVAIALTSFVDLKAEKKEATSDE